MSSSKSLAEELSEIFHPRPRRHYELNSVAPETSLPPTPSTEASDPSRLQPSNEENGTFSSRTRSVLNLTSSTLFGIYSPTSGGEEQSTPPSPAPNGISPPMRRVSSRTSPRRSMDDTKAPVIGALTRPKLRRAPSSHHHRLKRPILPLGIRTSLLFGIGVAYGIIISHLHDTPQIAPVQVQGIDRWSWPYLVGWGAVGVLLGGLLPWVDVFWKNILGNDEDIFTHSRSGSKTSNSNDEDDQPDSRPTNDLTGLGADWNPLVRSVGAFIGIAFAIRKLPWQSTLQVSLTLALVNPVLWYLVDRSKPGFVLSMLVGFAGTAVAFCINPDIVPSPAMPSPMASMNSLPYDQGLTPTGFISNESIGVGTWIASVLFCSSVCFGNIGRRLALGLPSERSYYP